jgi:2'-5' RNA ligase
MAVPLTGSSTERLFVASHPPDSVRAVISGLRTPLRQVRWTPDDQLHLTLRFLGNVEFEARASLIARLEEIHVEPFPLPLEGAGVFPVKGAPRVLWIGVGSGHPRLHQLRQKIDNAALTVLPGLDIRTFHPHLTVGRCTADAAASVKSWASHNRDYAGPVFLVEAFSLFASDLLPSGPQHRLIQTFLLENSRETGLASKSTHHD